MAASSAPILTLFDLCMAIARGLNFDNDRIDKAAIDVHISDRLTLDKAVSRTAYLAQILDTPIWLSGSSESFA